MAQRKIWTTKEDQLIKKLVKDNQGKLQEDKMKWGDIAQYLQQHIYDSHRTGKQCRQRWHNQLDPKIKGTEFSDEEIDKLFRLQNQMGNRWASIAREMPGRTDNNIKNFFYSSLRRALRQINCYVSKYKRKSNIKPFKQTILTKVLNINDEKYKDKLDIKGQQALVIAQQVKMMLAKLSQQGQDIQLNQQEIELRQSLVKGIQNFNKFCKKRKQKKQVQQDEFEMYEEELYTITENNRKEQYFQSVSKKYRKNNNRNKQAMVFYEQDCQIMEQEQKKEISKQNFSHSYNIKPTVKENQSCQKSNDCELQGTHQPFEKQEEGSKKIFQGILDQRQICLPLDIPDLLRKGSSRFSIKQSSKEQGEVFDFQIPRNQSEGFFKKKFESINFSRRQSFGENNLFNSLCIQSPMFASINIGEKLMDLDKQINESMIFK